MALQFPLLHAANAKLPTSASPKLHSQLTPSLVPRVPNAAIPGPKTPDLQNDSFYETRLLRSLALTEEGQAHLV